MSMKRKPAQANANFKLHDLTQPFLDLLPKRPSVKDEYLWAHITSKFVSRDTAPSEVRRTRAINKWLASEMNNEATNVRLMTVDPGYNILPRVSYEAFMAEVKSLCTKVLGEVVPIQVLNGSFSGGASTSRQRTSSHPAGKYVGEAHVTEELKSFAETVIGDSTEDLWLRLRGYNDLVVVPGNVLFTVPKTTEIDRCACKEPDLNMYLQKGTGDYIRMRLRCFGIDLNDQSRNRGLARLGSIDGGLATIDLSAASDSVTTELVFQALPDLWGSWLAALRCRVTIIDGDVHVNEMFSSMGNGFTFELESLLFWAISKVTARFVGASGHISVYGDDIIVPTVMAWDVINVLSFLGFSTNVEKTMIDGYVRESCGGHYSYGTDISPFYIRKPIDDLRSCILIANQLRKWCSVNDGLQVLDPDGFNAWRLLADRVPKCFWGGHDLDDPGRLVTAWQPSNPKRLVPLRDTKRTGIGGYLYWHDQMEHRNGSIETEPTLVKYSERVVESQVYGSRRALGYGMVTRDWFLEEIEDLYPA